MIYDYGFKEEFEFVSVFSIVIIYLFVFFVCGIIRDNFFFLKEEFDFIVG